MTYLVRVAALALAASSGACAMAAHGGSGDADAPRGDALVAELERAMSSLSGGSGAAAAESFDRAYWLNEARVTRSLTVSAAAVFTSDATLPYRMPPTEQALAHYFAARAWLAQGRPDEAAVDARRLSAFLVELADREEPLPPALMATLHDAAAAVFAVAGEWSDAIVAERLRDSYGLTAQSGACDSCGEIVLLVERGRVTSRVERTLTIAIADGDLAAIAAARHAGDGGGVVAAIARANAPRYCGWNAHAVCGWERRRSRDGPSTIVHVAWPELAPPVRATPGLSLAVGDVAVENPLLADVSASVAEDFGKDAPARLARAVARTALRQGLVKAGHDAMERAEAEADSKKRKKKDGAWRAAGVAAYVLAGVSTLAERADTRSWRSLPDELAVIRVRVPAGTHVVTHRGAEIANAEVKAGAVTIAVVRE